MTTVMAARRMEYLYRVSISGRPKAARGGQWKVTRTVRSRFGALVCVAWHLRRDGWEWWRIDRYPVVVEAQGGWVVVWSGSMRFVK